MPSYRVDVLHEGVVIRSGTFGADDDESARRLLPDKAPMLNTGIPLVELEVKLYRTSKCLIGEINGLLLAVMPSKA